MQMKAMPRNCDVPRGMPDAPRDTFFARGSLGQYVVIVPSERLVIVRFNIYHARSDDIETMNRLVGDVVAAIRAKAKPAR